jgi:hypothetical protein
MTRLRTLPLPVLLGLMLLAGLCTLLALNTASAAQELKQRSLTEANANSLDSEQQLLRDLASVQAPAALASAAAAQGLVPNPNPAFLQINADGSVTVLGSPTPASAAPLPSTPAPLPSPTKSAAKSAAKSGARSGATGSARPGASSSASANSGRPVVTVTVTQPAPSVTATRTATARPTPTATGGNR